MLLAVYGNFRQGQPLSYYVEDLRDGGEVMTLTLSGIRLYVVGEAPGAVITDKEEDKAVIEVIKTKGWTAERENRWMLLLDAVEGVEQGLYERNRITTPWGLAHIYTFSLPTKGMPVITDWLEWQALPTKEKYKAFGKLNRKSMLVGLRSVDHGQDT